MKNGDKVIDADFVDGDAAVPPVDAGEYCEDDDRHARGEEIPHDDGGEPIGWDDPPTDEHADKRTRSSGHFDPPAEAMVRDLQAMIDALQSEQIAEHAVIDGLANLRAKRIPRRSRHLGDASVAALRRIDDRGEGRERPIVTPWPDLNEQLPGGGLWPGAHFLVGGTGVQKTAAVISMALNHARDGGAVLYAGLEIDDEQAWVRFAADMADVRWSACMTGTATADERRRLHAVAPELNNLAIRLEPDDESGWRVSRLRVAVAEMLAEYPDKPLLVIVDFLQIISGEPDVREELRERIKTATYAAKHVSRRKGVTVLLVSSIAREAYGKVNGIEALLAAGVDAEMRGQTVVERFLRNRDALVGLGKESGESEYSADTVLVAMTVPRDPKQPDRRVVFAVAKARMGKEGWCSLTTNGTSFRADPTHGGAVVKAISDQLKKKKADRAAKSAAGAAANARGARSNDETDDEAGEGEQGPSFRT
ncbi:MAG: hypothetical protein RLZZ450_3088 [Pseudomonadota bacterium]|jgi:replicative DNA helicase